MKRRAESVAMMVRKHRDDVNCSARLVWYVYATRFACVYCLPGMYGLDVRLRLFYTYILEG